jgi:nucleotide-binding universal stress UspA family protein
MTTIRSILVGTDFSADGANAVRRATLLAQQLGASLSLLHVVDSAGFKPLRGWFSPSIDTDLKATQARSTLRQFAAEIVGRHDVAANIEVRVGNPHEELLRAAACVDLLVLGQRGRNPIRDHVIGGTADRLLRSSRTPVLLVKRAVEGSYRRVLVPVDFTPISDAAIRVAATITPDIGMQVFHAVDSAREAVLREADVAESILRQSRAREEAGVSARMRRSVARLGLDSRRMSFALGRGPAVRSTLQQARTLSADLIVVGKQGHSIMAGFLLGSVSSRLLTQAHCDMVVVPRAAHESVSSRSGFVRAGQIPTRPPSRSTA